MIAATVMKANPLKINPTNKVISLNEDTFLVLSCEDTSLED